MPQNFNYKLNLHKKPIVIVTVPGLSSFITATVLSGKSVEKQSENKGKTGKNGLGKCT